MSDPECTQYHDYLYSFLPTTPPCFPIDLYLSFLALPGEQRQVVAEVLRCIAAFIDDACDRQHTLRTITRLLDRDPALEHLVERLLWSMHEQLCSHGHATA